MKPSEPVEPKAEAKCACGHLAETHDGGGYCSVWIEDTTGDGAYGFCGCDNFAAAAKPVKYGVKELESKV